MTNTQEVIQAAEDAEPGNFAGRIRHMSGVVVDDETVRRARFDHSQYPELAEDEDLHAYTFGDGHPLGAVAIALKATGDGTAKAAIKQRVGKDEGPDGKLLRDELGFAIPSDIHELEVYSAKNIPDAVLEEAGIVPDESGIYIFSVPRPKFIAPEASAA